MKFAVNFMTLGRVVIELPPNFIKLRANLTSWLSALAVFSITAMACDVIGMNRLAIQVASKLERIVREL